MTTVLIVDDDSVSREVLERLFALRGFRTVGAPSGSDALCALSAANSDVRPDVVVLDVMMPEMDGYEVLERIRQDPRLRPVPVVMYSAIGDPRATQRARELGASDFIPKPTPFSEILQRVNRLIAH